MSLTLTAAGVLASHNPHNLEPGQARAILASPRYRMRLSEDQILHSLQLARALSKAPLPYINPQNITDAHQWEERS
jgi:hypothetical protein